MTGKTLLLLRHAKSDWQSAAGTDFDRPLATRGRAAAPLMGRHMAAQGLTPDVVLCSSALRTRETWERVAGELPGAPEVRFERTLYGGSPHDVVEVIRAGGGDAETVLVVGHHPGIDGAALMLAGTGDTRAADRIRIKFPTAALAVLEVPLDDWQALQPQVAELKSFTTPKDLEPDAADD